MIYLQVIYAGALVIDLLNKPPLTLMTYWLKSEILCFVMKKKNLLLNLAREELSLQVKHLDRQIRFDAPRRLQNVQEILHTHTPVILSGGTDIGLWVTKKHMELDHFLYLGNVEALNQIDEDDEGFVIGAAITHEGAMQKMGRILKHCRSYGGVLAQNR